MKIKTSLRLTGFLLSVLTFVLLPISPVFAATTPGLGQAASFAILSGTYTNTVGGTTINGDLGYTTGPSTAPTVNGSTHVVDTKYNQGGIDQNAALSNLAAQPCTTTFPAGPVDLATDTTGHSIGNYPPGVYCTTASSAASIGGGGTITLTGSGTYIFRINGAFTTSANSIVVLAGGASACDVFWTPTSATTLGATSTFVGTDIDASGITIGSTVNWTGRALAFGGTVSTTTDTITSTGCTAATADVISSSSSSSNNSSVSTGPGPCIAPQITNTPIIITSSRNSPTSVSLNWGPFSGTSDFNVRYGLQNGTWLYNTNVTGFSMSINDLPANQPIWVQVANRNNCAIGNYSEPRLVGGPRLANAGYASFTGSSTWYLTNDGSLASLSTLFQAPQKR